MELNLPNNRIGDSLLVTLPANTNSLMLEQECSGLLLTVEASGLKRVVFDCTAVELMDSADLSALAHVAKCLRVMGREAVLCGVQPVVAFAAVALDVDLSSITAVGTLTEICAN
ncbi:MAG: STAS domain-containing protein [Verrucomicrobia bacterium]|nr:STAS domain-containing protein [Verrucomicrobiota bacterium]